MTKIAEITLAHTRYFETEDEMKSQNDMERGDVCVCHIDGTKNRTEHWNIYSYDGKEWILVAEEECMTEEDCNEEQ